MTPIQAFLAGQGRDARGRSLAEILAWDDEALESVHDYIQWLFPLDSPSMAQPGSPVLSRADRDAIRADPTAQANIRRSAERLARFYASNDHWLSAYDHNHLRITRIVASLRILLGPEEAKAFLDAVEERCRAAGDPVNVRSRRYWRSALEG